MSGAVGAAAGSATGTASAPGRARWLRGALLLNALAQLGAGGLGFALAPERVLGAPVDEAARLGFRLAGFTNATTAAFTVYALVRLDVPALRALALCLAAYHALAGAEAARAVVSESVLATVGASAGPFHVGSCVVLGVGIGLARRVVRRDARLSA